MASAGVGTLDLDGVGDWPPAGDPVVVRHAADDDDVVADLVARHADAGGVHVSAAPVTDTVKTVRDGLVDGTLDRDRLVRLRPPVVLPHRVAATLPDPRGVDLCAWLLDLSRRSGVRWWEAPRPEGPPRR